MPVPLPVVMVRVDGPFTALDRKLWLLLLHNAWDELDTDKPYHEISVAELLRLFRRFGRTDLGTRGKIKLGKTEEDTEAAASVGQRAPPRQNDGRMGRRRLSGHQRACERGAC